MPAFPDIPPDRDSSRKVSFRILESGFGDGYGQVLPDGINHKDEEWAVSFKDYPSTEIDTIVSFLDSLEGYKSFSWTPPDEVTPKFWRMIGEYDVSFPGSQTRTLKAKFKRVYV